MKKFSFLGVSSRLYKEQAKNKDDLFFKYRETVFYPIKFSFQGFLYPVNLFIFVFKILFF